MRFVLSAALGAALALSACGAPHQDSAAIVDVKVVSINGTLIDTANIQQTRLKGDVLGEYNMYFPDGKIVDGDVCMSNQTTDLGCYTIEQILNTKDPETKQMILSMQTRFVEIYDREALPKLKKLRQEIEDGTNKQPDVQMQMPVDVTGITNTT